MQVIKNAWSSFDIIPNDKFELVIDEYASYFPRVGIPDHLVVYRGQDANSGLGLSWTTSKAVAKGFARGHRGTINRSPVVYELAVQNSEVCFLCGDREESEVVLFKIPRLSKLKLLYP